MMIRNRKLYLILIIVLAVPVFFTICCNPIRSGVGIQRALLKFYGLKQKKLPTKNGYLSFFEGGKGPTLIMVHGYIADAGNWYPVVSRLKKNFHLVIPDLPGHGDSDPKGDKLTPDDLLEGLMDLINEKSRNGKIILLGNSLGGWVSLMAVLQAQDKISALILENSAGLKTKLPERLLLPKDVSSAKELYQVLLGDESPQAPDFLYKDLISYLSQKRFTYLFHSISDKYFLDGKLGNIHIPVFLIWGANDKLFPVSYAEKMRKEIPKSELIVVKGTGHAMHFTKPGIFLKKFTQITSSLHFEPR